MAFLAAVPAVGWGTIASTALTTGLAIKQGRDQRASAEIQARQREEDANSAAAESQRSAIIERKRAQRMMSRARAVAGGGASDPTVQNILTDIDTQGEVNALNALFSGNTAARGFRQGAQIARNEGRAASTAGYFDAASTALSGGASWYEKYGAGK